MFKIKEGTYRLKKSPREWCNNMNTFQLSIYFKRLYGKFCHFYSEDEDDGTTCIILLYADVILIAGNSLEIINRVKNQLNNKYDMKGVVKQILGCEVKHEVETEHLISLSINILRKEWGSFFPDKSYAVSQVA